MRQSTAGGTGRRGSGAGPSIPATTRADDGESFEGDSPVPAGGRQHGGGGRNVLSNQAMQGINALRAHNSPSGLA